MTSRNRLLVFVAVVILAIAAAAGYLLSGKGSSSHPKAAATSTATAGSTAPKPSAPKSSPPGSNTPAPSGTWVPADPELADVCRTKLPSQAQDTLGLIAKGGPYPYNRDGIVFENRESRLPRKAGGYYHEFTVVTPGSNDRGTRRVVTGGAGEQYWSPDHYVTFQEIDPRC
ncbi:ribonuclease [Kitasatospora aureofaciens]|uniref:ribonuclease n=1 Tax=Kitasatospora aureofaciens TaxID=1894 RepID=UPI0038162F70